MTHIRAYDDWKRSLGIVHHGHWLVWGDPGALAWMPEPIKEAVVHVWNEISCRLMGHQDYGFGQCPNCCKPLPKDPRITEWLEGRRPKK